MRRSDAGLAVVVAVIWGVNFVVIDLGLRSFPPLLFVALRFAFVAVPAIFIVGRPRVKIRWIVAVGILLGAGQFGLLFVGIDRGMPAGLASLVLQAQALFTVLFAMLILGERPTRRQWLGLLAAGVGLAVIGLGRAANIPLAAMLLVLAAAASWGAGNIASRLAQPRNGLQLIVWASLVPPIPLAALSLVVDGVESDRHALQSWTWDGVAALAYLVLLATLVGFGTWTNLLRQYPASTVAPFALLVPVVGIAAAWVVLDEVPGPAELAGAVVVLVGLLVLSTSSSTPVRPRSASEVSHRHVRGGSMTAHSTLRPERPLPMHTAAADTDGMRQLLCPVLIGREEETQVLFGALDRAAKGRGGTFFVMGEAGLGKSRLVQDVSGEARSRGLLVLTGRAVSGAVPVAYRPLAEAVLAGLRRRGQLDVPELKPFQPALGRLVPEWLPPEPAPGLESPIVLGEGLLRLLRVLSGEHGCLLVLEDLHWADPESLAVLEYLADNLAAERIICIGTIRSEEPGAGRELIGTLVDRRAARVVDLPRLSDRAIIRMARACIGTAALPAEVEAFLVARADGVPFLVEELLAGLVGTGVLIEQEGRWATTGPLGERVPPTFSDAVGRRMDELSPGVRGMLHAAAVLGRRFDWSLLSATTGVDDAEVIAALRQAVNAQLLTAEADGFRFRHTLTRDAVLADLVPPERASLAARALVAVDEAHPDLPGAWCELAAELAEAAGNRTRASGLLFDAGRRATAAGALATAEATLQRARRLALDDPVLVVPIDDALTDVLALAGQVDRASELGDRLLARLDLKSRLPSGGAELHLRLARAGVAAGRWQVATDHLTAARRVPAVDQGGLAVDQADLAAGIDVLDAQVALGEGRLSEASQLAAAALAVAERAGLPAVACEALEVAGRVARQRDLQAAETAFARELAVATAHGLELWRLRALHELGTVDQLRTESIERLQQARELAVEVGASALVATLDLQIAAGLIKQFRSDEGLAAARSSADASRRLKLATLPMGLIQQAAAHAQYGRAEEMEACLAEALALATDDLDVQGSASGHCRATLALLAEDRSRALTEMTTGTGFLQRSPATVAPPFLGLRVLLLAVEGDDAVAQAEADRVRNSGATRHEIVASLLGYAEAVLLGRAGRGAEAAAAFADADAEMGPLVAWYRQYARRLAAEPALANGWGTPVAWLRESAAFFAARGDQQVAAACRALLRRAGAPVPRAGRGDPAVPASLRALGVTSREADVLGLVVEGLTNTELAARLHLSPRTVEKHVASLLAKTGCRRRAQLAGYAARLSG